MKRPKSIVSLHIILGAICSLPVLLTVVTGIFLIVRSHSTWMQPKASKLNSVKLEKILSPAKLIESAGINETNLSSIIYKPAKGIVQIRTKNALEYHVNAASGEVLNQGPKRTSFFIQLHEGSYFGSSVRDFIFLPSAIFLLVTLVTGIYLSYFWFKRELKFFLKKRVLEANKRTPVEDFKKELLNG